MLWESSHWPEMNKFAFRSALEMVGERERKAEKQVEGERHSSKRNEHTLIQREHRNNTHRKYQQFFFIPLHMTSNHLN